MVVKIISTIDEANAIIVLIIVAVSKYIVVSLYSLDLQLSIVATVSRAQKKGQVSGSGEPPTYLVFKQ